MNKNSSLKGIFYIISFLWSSVLTITNLHGQLRNLEEEKRNENTKSFTIITRKYLTLMSLMNVVNNFKFFDNKKNGLFLELREELREGKLEHTRDQTEIKSKLSSRHQIIEKYFFFLD